MPRILSTDPKAVYARTMRALRLKLRGVPPKDAQATHQAKYTERYAAQAAELRTRRLFLAEGRIEVVMCEGGACCSWQDGSQDSGVIVRGMTAREARDWGSPALPQSFSQPGCYAPAFYTFYPWEHFPEELRVYAHEGLRHGPMAPKSLWIEEEK